MPSMPRVLLVDDDESSRRLVHFVLDPGCEILEACNGEDALELAVSGRPDIVLLDVRMPGLGGPETCARLKADPRTRAAKVVMVTASDDLRDQVKSRLAGADAYLVKPYRPFELATTVYDLLAASGIPLVASGRARERWLHRHDPARV